MPDNWVRKKYTTLVKMHFEHLSFDLHINIFDSLEPFDILSLRKVIFIPSPPHISQCLSRLAEPYTVPHHNASYGSTRFVVSAFETPFLCQLSLFMTCRS